MTNEERADILADDGYRYIEIDGELYRADMVAWALQTGEWPEVRSSTSTATVAITAG